MCDVKASESGSNRVGDCFLFRERRAVITRAGSEVKGKQTEQRVTDFVEFETLSPPTRPRTTTTRYPCHVEVPLVLDTASQLFLLERSAANAAISKSGRGSAVTAL